MGDPQRDWGSEKKDKDPNRDHRPFDHSGGSSADPGDIGPEDPADAADDPEDHNE